MSAVASFESLAVSHPSSSSYLSHSLPTSKHYEFEPRDSGREQGARRGREMFYSHSLLSRKGPLGTIWVAAHCFKKLKKDQIDHTDISSSVDKIMPEIQISYRVLAQLLLGIVRIFSKKVDYLYHDCNEALTCIIKSFTHAQCTVTKGAIARPRRHSIEAKGRRSDHNIGSHKEPIFAESVETMRAPYHYVTISVPERFSLDSFDLDIPDYDDAANTRPHEQSTPRDHWLDDNNDPSFLNECNHRESVMLEEINSLGFTPVNDVLPFHMMDIDLEFHDGCNLSSGEAKEVNLQEDIRCDGQLEAKESLVPIMTNGKSEDRLHPVQMMKTIDTDLVENVKKLQEPVEPLVSYESFSSNYKNFPACTNQDATHPTKTHNEAPLPCDLGVPSPIFAVRTPAKKEHHQMRKKRKSFFDETIVLSNETLRKGIHDASNLVFKRRKAPHTSLDSWKSKRISNLQQNFLEPLIPCMASKLRALFQRSSSFYSPVNIPADHHLESGYIENKMSNKSTEVEDSYHETVTEVSLPDSCTEVPRTDKINEIEMKKLSPLELSDTGLDFMDQEFARQESNAIGQDNRWSLRTRAVAQYLYSKLLHPRGEEQKGCLTLHQILQGSKRSGCARFFYEILILKGHESIDVNQDSPYGEIIISSTPKLEAVLKSGQCRRNVLESDMISCN